MTYKNALTIAGSDSGGGAGIQADLKSFSANGVYGASVITAVTAQNTAGVSAIHDLPIEIIASQMDAVFSDIPINATKIGMLSRTTVIETVAEGLKRYNVRNIVLDPVMVATSGDLLLDEHAIETVRTVMMPLADLLTPNLHEAAALTGNEVADSEVEMQRQAELLCQAGAKAVLIKGGHGSFKESSDLLVSSETCRWFRSERIETKNTHGTGCSLSSAIAAWLARGASLETAVSNSKHWLTAAIAASNQLDVGKGAGPVHHLHELWRI